MKDVRLSKDDPFVLKRRRHVLTSGVVEKYYTEDISSRPLFEHIQCRDQLIRSKAVVALGLARSSRQDLRGMDEVLSAISQANGFRVHKFSMSERIMFLFYVARPMEPVSELSPRQVYVSHRVLRGTYEASREQRVAKVVRIVSVISPKIGNYLSTKFIPQEMNLVVTERALQIMFEREERWSQLLSVITGKTTSMSLRPLSISRSLTVDLAMYSIMVLAM